MADTFLAVADAKASDSRVKRSANETWVLIGILALAGALRVWGVEFGLPNTVTRPDENTVVGTAARLMTHRTFDPAFFSYPSVYIYLLAGLYAAGCAGTVLARVFPDVGACVAAWPRDWTPLFLTARMVTVVAGVATVAAVVAIGRRLHPSAGLIAGLFLSVAFLHVRDSHFGVTDVPMTALLVVTVLLVLRAHEQPSVRRFVMAGLVGGLAASTKYNAVLVGGSVVVSEGLAWLSPREADPVRHRRLLWFTGAAAVAFLIGTPYALLAPSRVWHDARAESLHLFGVHAGIRLGVGWQYHALVTLPQGLGWPLLLAGVAGILLAFVRTPRQAALVFSFPLLYYVVAGHGYTVFTRYMVPMVPFLCLGAGAFVSTITSVDALSKVGVRRVAVAALVAICALPTALKAIAFDRVLTRVDSRLLAADWLAAHAQPGSWILAVCSNYGAPQMWKRGQPMPFRVSSWDTDAQYVVEGARPDFIVVEQSGLLHYSPVHEELQPVLKDYELRHVIRTYDPDTPHVWDQQDGFYLPLDGFASVARPGPTLLIYERHDRFGRSP